MSNITAELLCSIFLKTSCVDLVWSLFRGFDIKDDIYQVMITDGKVKNTT